MARTVERKSTNSRVLQKKKANNHSKPEPSSNTAMANPKSGGGKKKKKELATLNDNEQHESDAASEVTSKKKTGGKKQRGKDNGNLKPKVSNDQSSSNKENQVQSPPRDGRKKAVTSKKKGPVSKKKKEAVENDSGADNPVLIVTTQDPGAGTAAKQAPGRQQKGKGQGQKRGRPVTGKKKTTVEFEDEDDDVFALPLSDEDKDDEILVPPKKAKTGKQEKTFQKQKVAVVTPNNSVVTDDTPAPVLRLVDHLAPRGVEEGPVAGPSGTNAKKVSKAKKAAAGKSVVKLRKQGEARPAAGEPTIEHVTHLTTPGQVLTLGEGDTGQLGLGPDIMERTKPGLVKLPEGVVQVCAGGMHTVCVTRSGCVYTWGCNDEGALGRLTPEEEDCMVPGLVSLPNQEKVVQVSAGDSHTAALTQTGRLYLWGLFREGNGVLGLTAECERSDSPKLIEIDSATSSTVRKKLHSSTVKVCKIASGSDHLAFVTMDGELYTCGNASNGQLGRVPEYFLDRGGRRGAGFLLTPTKVCVKNRKVKFSNVWTGSYATYALTTEGDVYSTGLNNYYQLGFKDMKNRLVLERARSFDRDKEWKELSAGQHHTLALDGQGKVYSLGRKEYGRLGLTPDENEAAEKWEPTLVPSLSNKKCINVASGNCASFALTQEGQAYAWGMGTTQQLGQDDDEDVWEPTLMKGKQLVERKGLQISAGGQHTVVLATDAK